QTTVGCVWCAHSGLFSDMGSFPGRCPGLSCCAPSEQYSPAAKKSEQYSPAAKKSEQYSPAAKQLTDNKDYLQHLSWSPDGKYFLVTRYHKGKVGLWTVTADGKD